MSRTRSPQQIQVDVDLLKERITLFELAMQFYSHIPITRRPEDLNFSYLKNRVMELKNCFEKLSKTLRNSQNKLTASTELQHRVFNQITEHSEERFIQYMEKGLRDNPNRLTSLNDIPQLTAKIPREPSSHHHHSAPFDAIVAANNHMYDKILHLEARWEGDPDILREPLANLVTHFFKVIENAYERCATTQEKTALINKFYVDIQLFSAVSTEKVTPLPLSTFENFKDAFLKKFADKPLVGFDPKLISIMDLWLNHHDDDFTLAQKELISLQHNQPISFDEKRHHLHFNPDMEKALDEKKGKLQSDMSDWMQHTSEHLMPASEKIRREAEGFNDFIQREVDGLKKLEKWKKLVSKWIQANELFLPVKSPSTPKTAVLSFFQKAPDTHLKWTLLEKDVAECEALYQEAKKLRKSKPMRDELKEFFSEKMQQLQLCYTTAAKSVDQLILALDYLKDQPSSPCFNGMAEDFIRKAQTNLIEAKEGILKIKAEVQSSLNIETPLAKPAFFEEPKKAKLAKATVAKRAPYKETQQPLRNHRRN